MVYIQPASFNKNSNLRKFWDFDSSYIASVAQQRGYDYSEILETQEPESGLYNNPKTNTTKQHAIRMTIDGLACEYYTADFTPVIFANSTIMNSLKNKVYNKTQSRYQVQIFSVTLPYKVENVYIESRTNITLNNILGLSSVAFKNSEKVRLEGEFNAFFRVYVPKNEAVNAFAILAPNIMVRLLQDAGDYDFEFAGNRVYFYQTFSFLTEHKIPLKQKTYDGLLEFGINSAKAMARATRPAQVTEIYNTAMWQLYGTNNFKLVLIIMAIAFSIFFIFLSIAIPLLWPIPVLLIILFGVRYFRLLSKRKRLLANWGNRED